MGVPYNKPPLPPDKQADLLLKRGLRGISKQELVTKLNSINYYRLRGYTYPYQDNTKVDSPFLASAQWPHIWSDYVMDSKLRALFFEGISHIEIAFRTQLELVMSLHHGPRWYADGQYFFDESRHTKDLAELKEDWNRSEEDFKKHYEATYDQSLDPPAWMIFETSTFGVISKFYNNMDNSLPEKVEIARYFGFTKSTAHILTSWMRHLNTVRNICAHHSRLFSRVNIIQPRFPNNMHGKWVASWPNAKRIYSSVCIIKKLLDACAPKYNFAAQLKPIIAMARKEQLPSMGFPADWGAEPLFL